jgi:hypothetical protein
MDALIGRDRELETLGRLVDHLSERGAAVLVTGAAGNARRRSISPISSRMFNTEG